MKTNDISEIREKLENDITDLLRKFQIDTGLTPDGIIIYTSMRLEDPPGGGTVVGVKLEIG